MAKDNFSNQNTANKSEEMLLSRGFLNVVLVFLESAITLMLRFDPKLRQLAFPLAEAGKVVCIRTYLPHTKVYVSFSYRGVLLDDALPDNKQAPDVVINAYSFQLFQILTNHSTNSVDALQIRGNTTDVEQVKAFLVRVGVGGTIQSIISKFKGAPKEKLTEEQKAEKFSNYRAKIAEQSKQIEALNMEKSRLKTQLLESQGKQKATMAALIIAVIVSMVAIALHFIL